MKILWLGMVASNEMFSKMPVRTIGQASAHAAQNSILKGLDNINVPVDTISAHNYPAYPVYPNKYVQEEKWTRTGISNDICVGFKNIKYLSHLSKTRALKQAIDNWLRDNQGVEKIHIIVYSLHSPFLHAANYAKKRNKKVCVHVIVPDLPSFVDMGASSLKKYLKRIDWLLMKKLFSSINKFILFTKQMADFMVLESGKWVVIEGSVNRSEIEEVIKSEHLKRDHKIVIMYAGVIDKYRGIIELLEAFESINYDNIELWLAGSGSADSYVEEKAKLDPRIKQLGYIVDRKKIIELEHEASILINTGLPDDEVSKYCFPSKLFEYMASGNPVVSVKSPGIPDEYFEYIIGIPSMSREDILEGIQKVIKMSNDGRQLYGNRAKEFVLEQKNQTIQAKKLIDFIKTK